MSTIFSKIIARELPANIIYEDERVLAFLDINPVQPGHTLVIPKIASESGLFADPEDLSHIIKVAQKIALAQIVALACDGVNFSMNNGAAAGQKVFHTHLHVIPRFNEDGAFEEPLHGTYEEREAEELTQVLISALKN